MKMTDANDYRNGSGYICPTENEALTHLDQPKRRRHRVQVMDEKQIRAMDTNRPPSFGEFVLSLEDGPDGEPRAVLRDPDKTVRQLFSCLDAVASIAGFRIDAIMVHSKETGMTYAK